MPISQKLRYRSMDSTYGDGGDVRQVGGDTGSVDDIVERELVDEGREREEEGQRLANATGSTCDD